MKWPTIPMEKAIEINPRSREWAELSPDTPVGFVPMAAISEATASIREIETRPLADVRKGFTPFRNDDVLFAKITPCMENGKAALARNLPNGIGFGSTEFHVLRAKEGVLPKFVYFFIRQQSFRSDAKTRFRGAAGQQRVPEDFLLPYPFPLPAPREQGRIVEVLEQADALRQKCTEANALAERILPALFQRLFGDPARNPKNLPVVPLGELTTRVTKGESPGWQGFQYQDEGPVFVTSENVRWGKIDLSVPKHIPKEFHQKLERSALKPADVLINLVGASIGRSCIVPKDIGEANVNQAVAVVTCGPKLLPEYLGSLLLTPAAQTRLHGGKVEAARANISLSDVRRFPVLYPRIEDQERFVVMRKQSTTILKNRDQTKENIKKLFAIILHRAFTGELTAQWREAHMKELLAEMEQQARLLRSTTKGRN